jgi:TIR domain
MAHIFISYSRKEKDRDDNDENKEIVDKLKQRLSDEQFEVWIDKSDIPPGYDWWGTIVKAIKECSAFAIILSSYSLESPIVLRELSVALEFEKPIFPLLLPDGEPWTHIKHIQCAKSIDELIGGLRGTRLFISYAAEDEGFAAKLADSLTRLDAKVWRSKDISSIQEMLKSSQIMLLVLSPESMESPAIREQWQAFDSKSKQIIPLLVRRTTVPPKLRETQPYVDFFNQDYSIAFGQLYGILQAAGINLKEHEKVLIPPQPQLSLSRYDMSNEAQEAIWVSGITLDTFVKDSYRAYSRVSERIKSGITPDTFVYDSYVYNPELDVRLLMLALDVRVANETGTWTGINTLVAATMDEDLKPEELAALQLEYEAWKSLQDEALTDEGHWVAWRLFRNREELKKLRKLAPNIQIRTIPHRLAMGYCIIDPNREESEGILTASPYFYKIDYLKATRPQERNVAPIFLSNRSPKQSDRWWFAQYVQEFERLWEDATCWNLD